MKRNKTRQRCTDLGCIENPNNRQWLNQKSSQFQPILSQVTGPLPRRHSATAAANALLSASSAALSFSRASERASPKGGGNFQGDIKETWKKQEISEL